MEIGGFCGSLSFHLTPDFPSSSDREGHKKATFVLPRQLWMGDCTSPYPEPDDIERRPPTLLSVSAFDHLSAQNCNSNSPTDPLKSDFGVRAK